MGFQRLGLGPWKPELPPVFRPEAGDQLTVVYQNGRQRQEAGYETEKYQVAR